MTQSSHNRDGGTKKPRVKHPGRGFIAVFFHPDCTVGYGITPYLQIARGLVGQSRITAGGDFHPAPKTYYLLIIYHLFTHLSILNPKKTLYLMLFMLHYYCGDYLQPYFKAAPRLRLN
jgi:hypothetical protein